MSDKINKIIRAFNRATTIVINNIECKASIYDLTGDPINKIIHLTDEDIACLEDRFESINIDLTEMGLENAIVSSNKIICTDHDGEPVEIRLFKSVELIIEL